jgi:aspartyl-tRNA(Asn)/glutamyl-tRNA(Gln) amidotransferase subunit A
MNSQINKMLHELKSKGATVEEVELNFTHEYGVPIYYVIAVSEASTNLACLCGLRYGAQSSSNKMHFVDYFTKTRSENFGKEAKRRIMLGTFMRMAGYRDAFYIKAAKARTKVIEEYKNHFKNYDILITPTMPFVAPKFEDIKKLKPIDHYLSDIMTVGPNLAGIPHMSFPVGKIASDGKNMPFGIMVMSDHFKENTLLEFGKLLESLNSKEELIIGGEKHV